MKACSCLVRPHPAENLEIPPAPFTKGELKFPLCEGGWGDLFYGLSIIQRLAFYRCLLPIHFFLQHIINGFKKQPCVEGFRDARMKPRFQGSADIRFHGISRQGYYGNRLGIPLSSSLLNTVMPSMSGKWISK